MHRATILLLVGALACSDGSTDPETPTPELEVCTFELPRVTPSAEPGAGPDWLGEADSDDNGLSDRDEWGTDPLYPVDTDLDGVPDYEDLDDDADGLLDVHDPERLAPASPVDLFAEDAPSGPFVLDAITERDDDWARGVAREGELVTLEGVGFGCDLVVAFLGGDLPMNVVAEAADDDVVRVRVPAGAQGPVAVFRGHARGATVPLDVRPADGPILYETNVIALVGSTVTLRGESLSGVTQVRIDELALSPSAVREDEVDVLIPATMADPLDEVYVEVGEARSNRVALRVVHEIAATFTAPEHPAARILHHRGESAAPVLVAAHGVDVLTVADADRTIFDALTLPSDTSVEIDAESSAVKAVMIWSGGVERVAISSLETLRDRVRALAETSALAGAMEATGDQEDGLGAADAYASELEAAINAATLVIDEGLEDGSLMPRDFALPIVTAEISGPATRYDDISLRQDAATGVVSVQNDTDLYLSAEAFDLRYRRATIPHVSGAFDPGVLGAAGMTRLGGGPASAPARIVRDTRVQVVTPGGAGLQPETAEARAAQSYMFVRTIAEQLIAPLLELVIDKVVDGGLVTKLLIKYAFTTLKNALDLYRINDVDGALSTVLDFVYREAISLGKGELSGGPLLLAVLETVFRGPIADIVRQVSQDLAAKIVPGIGQVKAALSAISGIRTGAKAIRTYADMLSAPGLLEFDVTFGLAVTNVRPDEVERRCVLEALIIEGAGFDPVVVDGETRLPEVRVRDLDPNGFDTFVWLGDDFARYPESERTSTHMTIPISEDYMSRALGPLEVTVTHFERDDDGELVESTLRAPREVPVVSSMELEAIDPASAEEGETISLFGRGFESSAEVVFSDPMTGTQAARVTPTSVSPGEISIVVPSLPMGRPSWDVRVELPAALCAHRSQPQPFSTATGGLFDVFEVDVVDGASYSLRDINDAGQVVGTQSLAGTPTVGVRITPRAASMDAPLEWTADADGDLINDFAEVFTLRSGATEARPNRINATGLSGGLSRGPASWATPSAEAVDLYAVLEMYVQNVLFPAYGISWVMMPHPNDVLAINAGGDMLLNTNGIVIRGGRPWFPGGDPTCDGCIAGRTNVGRLVYAHGVSGRDMNDAGVTCGQADDGGRTRPATWSIGGSPTFLPELAPGGYANAINASGTVVGNMPPAAGMRPRAVIWQGGTATVLDTFGGENGSALDVENGGAVIGWAENAAGVHIPFLYLPAPRWGVSAGLHRLADLVSESLLLGEQPIRINNMGMIITDSGRVLVPAS